MLSENMLIALITGCTGIISATISAYLGYKSGQKKKKLDTTDISLETHPYFNRVECLKNEILRTFTLPNKGKEEVFKEIIYRHMDICHTKYMHLVREVTKNEGNYDNNVSLYNLHIEALDQILSELHEFYKYDNRYTDNEKKVMDVVMQKYCRWSQDKIHTIQEQIMLTCNSPFYINSSPIIKTSILLDQYLSLAIDLINSATATLNKINGDLKGLIFKGIEI